MDSIRITGLTVFARHGVFEEEQKLGQKFCINLELFLSLREAGREDRLDRSIDYGEVAKNVCEWFSARSYKLIEAAAEMIATRLLCHYPAIREVSVEVEKPWAPVGLPLEQVSVQIRRGWHTAYLGLGSNMGDREAYLNRAVDAFRAREDCRVEKVSDFIETQPYGPVKQEYFLNGCMKVSTLLLPEELLECIHSIEANADRKREVRWGPRTLDIDILFYDAVVRNEQALTIPHADLPNRRFVLEPLCQIAPRLWHPLMRKTVKQMLDALPSEESPRKKPQ